MYGEVKPLRGEAEAKASLKWAIESYVVDLKPMRSIHDQVEARVKSRGGPNPR
jgi:hypothetical protein